VTHSVQTNFNLLRETATDDILGVLDAVVGAFRQF
jgi:hypothetical protein